jgi:hypothetical protein
MRKQWPRRVFFGSAVLLFFMGKIALAQLVGAPPPVSVEQALGFIRTFNTLQVVLYQQNGKCATQDEAFAEIIKHKEHVKPGTWMTRFTPMVDEVFPGWTLDFAIIPGESRLMSAEQEDGSQKPLADGYRLILKGEQYTLITDEGAVIYQAKTPEKLPAATSLPSAAEFPGAMPY